MSVKMISRFILILSCLIAANCYALPFNIVPKAGVPFPTTVVAGQTRTAYYTVTNNTASPQAGNFIKYLPPNTTQVTSGGTYGDTCGSTFDLAANGQANSSCTLQLTITGPVNGNDPDPHNHLFACFVGGLTCAGTPNPLNIATITLSSISVTPASINLHVGDAQQYTATANYSDGTSVDITSTAAWNSSDPSIATISSTGLANVIYFGVTNITATELGVVSNAAVLSSALTSISVTPATIHLNVGDTQQYTAIGSYPDSTTVDVTNDATWTSSNTSALAILSTGFATVVGFGMSNITAELNVMSNTAMMSSVFAYVSSINNTSLSVCPVNTDNSFGTCSTTVASFTSPRGVALNPARTFAYVANSGSDNIRWCSVNNNGTLSGCANTGTGLDGPSGIVIAPSNNFAYITNLTSGELVSCAIGGGGALSSCAAQGSVFTNPIGIALNSAGTHAYITSSPDAVTVCDVPGDGTLNCDVSPTGSGFNNPQGIVINNSNTIAYIVNTTGLNVSMCTIASNGRFNSCTNALTLSGVAFGITLNSSGTIAYITEGTTVLMCVINNDGTFGACVDSGGTGFNLPLGIALT